MKISNVRIRFMDQKVSGEPVAWAECVIEDAIALKNIAIHHRDDGSYRIAYPAKTSKHQKGKRFYFFNPINEDCRLDLEEAILGKLEELTGVET